MKVNIEIDDKYKETAVTIQTNEWTKELDHLVQLLKQEQPKRLFGVKEDQTILLNPSEIDFIYAEKRKVYAKMNNKQIEIRMKLFEVENSLKHAHFMRFSKSVIGNIDRIQRFELSFNGNLCVYFVSGNKEYITRKYVASIKERLTTGGSNHE